MEEQVRDLLAQGLNCAQVVFLIQGRRFAWDEAMMKGAALAFGGGMGKQLTCGCVTGAYMAIGCYSQGDKAEAKRLQQAFDEAFLGEFETLSCAELLDTTDPPSLREKYQTFCPQLMEQAGFILNELLA